MSIKLNAQSGGSVALDAPPQTTSSADITFKLPVADGSANQVIKTDGSGNLGFVAQPTGGLAMADQWRYTATITQTNTHNHFATTSNWERPDSKLGIASNPLGTGMTQSGGIFSFPSTGYYYIMFQACAKVDNDSCELFAMIRATDDNSSYDNVAEYLSTIQNQCTPNYNTANVNYLARVTNISNHKIQFRVQNSGLSVTWMGETTKNRIAATFLKVGDI